MGSLDDIALWTNESFKTSTFSHANTEDVIYGRGNHLKMHPGNKHYRTLIKALKEYYVKFPKDKKKIVSRLIYESIKGQNPPGRFLREIEGGQYAEIETEDAIRKISQCLREKQAQYLKETDSGRRQKLTQQDFYTLIKEMRDILDSINHARDIQKGANDILHAVLNDSKVAPIQNKIDSIEDSKPDSDQHVDVVISEGAVLPLFYFHDRKHKVNDWEISQPTTMDVNSMHATMASHSNNDILSMQTMEHHDDRQLSAGAVNHYVFNVDNLNANREDLFHDSNNCFESTAHLDHFNSLRSQPHRYSRSIDHMTAAASSYNTRESLSATHSDNANVVFIDNDPFNQRMRNMFLPSNDSSDSIHSLSGMGFPQSATIGVNNLYPHTASHSSNDLLKTQTMEHYDDQQLTAGTMNHHALNVDDNNSNSIGLTHKINNRYESTTHLDHLTSMHSSSRRYSRSLYQDDNMTASASSYKTRESSSAKLSDDSNLLRSNDHPYTQAIGNSFLPSVDSSTHSFAEKGFPEPTTMDVNNMYHIMTSYSNNDILRERHYDRQPSAGAMNYPPFNEDVYNSIGEGLFHDSNNCYEATAHLDRFSPMHRSPHRHSRSLDHDDNMTSHSSSYNTREGSSVTLSDDSNLERLKDQLYTETIRNSFLPPEDLKGNPIHSLAQHFAEPSFWYKNIPEYHSSPNNSSFSSSSIKDDFMLDIDDVQTTQTSQGLELLLDGHDPENYGKNVSVESGSIAPLIALTFSHDYNNHVLDLVMMSSSFLSAQQVNENCTNLEPSTDKTKSSNEMMEKTTDFEKKEK